jgi:WD40 repeat protein
VNRGICLCNAQTFQIEKTLRAAARNSGDPIALALSPDGKTLATLDERELTLWDVAVGKARQAHPLPHDPRTTGRPHVLFSARGDFLLACNGSTTISLRDPLNGEEEESFELPGAPSPVSLVLSPNGKYLALAGKDGAVELWDFEKRHILSRLAETPGTVSALAFAPDNLGLAAGGTRGTTLWTLPGGGVRLNWDTDQKAVSSLAYFPENPSLATGGEDGTIKIWNVSSIVNFAVVERQQLVDPRLRFAQLVRTRPVRAAFSPSGTLLAMGDPINGLRPWRGLRPGGERKAAATQSGQLAFTTDGVLLLRGENNQTQVWEVAARRQSGTTLPGPHVAVSAEGTRVACANDQGLKLYRYPGLRAEPDLPEAALGIGPVVFSPDGKLLACASRPDTIHVWDMATRKIRIVLESFNPTARIGPFQPVNTSVGLAFTADSKRVISGSSDQALHFWDVATGTERLRLPLPAQPMSLALSPTEPLLAVWGDNNSVWFFDADNGATRGTFSIQAFIRPEPGCLAFSPDGRCLVTASIEQVRGWRVTHLLEPAGRAPTPNTPAVVDLKVADTLAEKGSILLPLPQGLARMGKLSFSLDGTTLTVTRDEARLRQLDLTTGNLIWEKRGGQGNAVVALSQDGVLAHATGGIIRIREPRTGNILRSIDLGLQPFDRVHELAWAPGGKLLAARVNQETRLLDLTAAQQVRTLETIRRPFAYLVFSKDGSKYTVLDFRPGGGKPGDQAVLDEAGAVMPLFGGATAFAPRTGVLVVADFRGVNLIDVRQGKTVGSVKAGNPRVETVAISPDGKLLATAGMGDEVRLWDTQTREQAAVIKLPAVQPLGGLAFSPDGKRLAVLGNEGIHLWRIDAKSPAVKWLKAGS